MRSRLGSGAAESSQTQDSNVKLAAPKIDVKIDRLVLAGISPGARHGIAEAMNRELTRLLSEQRSSPSLRDSTAHDAVDGGNIAMELSAAGETMGNRIAQAVYRGIGNATNGGFAPPASWRNLPKS